VCVCVTTFYWIWWIVRTRNYCNQLVFGTDTNKERQHS